MQKNRGINLVPYKVNDDVMREAVSKTRAAMLEKAAEGRSGFYLRSTAQYYSDRIDETGREVRWMFRFDDDDE